MEPRTRMNKREMDKEPIRETVREPNRSKTKEVIGRNGKVLSRKRGNNIDKFFIPPHLIPPELTKEARQEDYTAARNLMDYQRQQLGQMLPRGFDGVRPQVKQTYEPSDVSRPRLAIED